MTLEGLITIALAGAIVLRIAWPYLFRHAPQAATRSSSATTASLPPAPASQPPADQTTEAIPQASATAWLSYVNNDPDRVPHVAICAPSGSGKTTLARAILGQRDGQIVVLTAKEGDDWGGLPYVGIDLDATYTTAEQTFQALDAEVKRRLIAAKLHDEVGDWLTVVLDDYSTLRSVCPAADAPFKLIARLGRSLRVRLMVLSDSAQVKAWGIEGEGETRNNFAFLLGKRGHLFTTVVDETTYRLDTSDVPRLAQVRLAARAWQSAATPDADRLLASILSETPLQAQKRDVTASESDVTEKRYVTNAVATPAEIARIAVQLTNGVPPSEIAKALPGYDPRTYKDFKAKVSYVQELLAAEI